MKHISSGNRWSKVLCAALICVMLFFLFGGCAAKENESVSQTLQFVTESSGTENRSPQEEPSVSAENPQEIKPTEPEQTEEPAMQMKINDVSVTVQWENNDSVAALIELVREAPLMIQMSMYGGFEQVGSIGTSLPRNDEQTTTAAGDIVLYSGNRIVVFYGSNSWTYTKLGRITDKSASEITDLLGSEDVTITITRLVKS